MHTDTRPPPRRHSRATRRTLATLTASAVLALPAVAFATGAQADDTCTPSKAWSQTIPAVGERTVIVDNPDYVPAVDAVYGTEHHPAVTETTTHYQRYSWNPQGQGAQVPPAGSIPPGDSWQPNTTNYENGHSDEPVGQAFSVASPSGNASWFYWTSEQEVTVIRDAWDEVVMVSPGTPAQGDPQIEVENRNYVPARQIDHPEVVCKTDTPVVTPTTVAPTTSSTPVTIAAAGVAATTTTPDLAATGSNTWTGAVVATVLLLLGSVLTVVSHRRTARQH